MAYAPSVPQSPWILRPRVNPAARVRLFCIPYAGGGSAAFRPWAPEAPADVELCLVQLPGRESRWKERPLTRVDEVVAALAVAVRPLLDRPYALFGHSLGALISFELVRALRAQRAALPVHLFVSAHRAPSRPNPHTPIGHLADAPFVDEIGRRYGGIPQAVLDSPELLALMLPMLRADIRMFEAYVHRAEAPLACPISAFGGEQDTYVRGEELAEWALQTERAFRIRMLPGDHFFVQGQRTAIVTAIGADLVAALGAANAL
jgi:medium-chain acyl-[acyl-carrier-protein] hydrolase